MKMAKRTGLIYWAEIITVSSTVLLFQDIFLLFLYSSWQIRCIFSGCPSFLGYFFFPWFSFSSRSRHYIFRIQNSENEQFPLHVVKFLNLFGQELLMKNMEMFAFSLSSSSFFFCTNTKQRGIKKLLQCIIHHLDAYFYNISWYFLSMRNISHHLFREHILPLLAHILPCAIYNGASFFSFTVSAFCAV